MMTTEISTAREQQLFNGKNFHVVIYNKTESVSGLHQHDYYEFTVVLTGRYYRRSMANGCCWSAGISSLSRWGRTTKAFTNLGRRASLTSASADASLKHYLPLLPFGWWPHRFTPCRALFSATLSRSSPHSIFAKRNLTNLSSWFPFMSLTVYATIAKSRLPMLFRNG